MFQLGGALVKEVGVKVKIIFAVLIARRVIDVLEEKLQVFCALVCDHNLHARLEGHRDEAVEALAFGTGKESGLKSGHVSGSERKEISERRAHGWSLKSIPKHFDLQSSEHGGASIACCDPDSPYRPAHALRLGQHDLFIRFQGDRSSPFSSPIGLPSSTGFT